MIQHNSLKGALKRIFGDKIYISKDEEHHRSINIKQETPVMIFEQNKKLRKS